MKLAKMRSELAELKVLASGKRRADVYVPRDEWQPGLRALDQFWQNKIALSEDPYKFLLENLDRFPRAPLKPEFAHMPHSEAGCREVYELTLGGLRR